MKYNLLAPLSLVILIAASSSCSRKEVNVRKHNTAQPAVGYEVNNTTESSQSDNLIYKSRAELYKILESEDSVKADQFLAVHFDGYINDFFNKGNNLSTSVKNEVTDLINNLIVISSKRDEYSEKLLSNVFYGCNQNLRGCAKFDLYPKTRSSSEMILHEIKEPPFTVTSAAKLLYVMQAYGGTPDPEMFLLIMENRSKIDEYLKSHSSLNSEGANIVDLAIIQVKNNSDRSPKFKQRYCETVLESDWVNSIESPVKTYSDKENILGVIVYCRSTMGSLYDVFKNRLVEEKNADEASFLSKYSKKGSKFFSRFSVEKDLISLATDNGSLELFVLDRFFEEKISLSVASDLISEFGKLDDLTFLRLIQAYIKSYFSYKTDSAFDTITGELKKSIKAENGLSSTTLVDVTQSVSKASYEEWTDVAKKYGNLEGLIQQLFGSKINKGSFQRESREIYFSIKDQLEKNNFEETVKQNVEHPVQLFISYFLSNLTGRAKFYFPWVSGTNKFYDIDLRTALQDYVNTNRAAAPGSYSLFLFSSNPDLKSSDLKVRNAFFKASKFGLFEKMPFDKDDIIQDKPVDYIKNVKDLFEQLFSKLLENDLGRRNEDYKELKEKYLDRDNEGIKEIQTYCSDPFGAFVEHSFSSLNTKVSLPSSTSDSASLVFEAVTDASDTGYWTNWKTKRDMISEFAKLVNMGTPEAQSVLNKYINDKFKAYEAPIIAMSNLKKELRKEIFGTKCLKNTVEIEKFRLSFMYEKFDSFIKSLYLMAQTSLRVSEMNSTDFYGIDLLSIVNEITKGKDLDHEAALLYKQIGFLFNDEEVKKFFNVANRKISKENALEFLRKSVSAHNNKALGNKVGFLAIHVPLDADSKNFSILNYINVTGNTLTISKWDLYMRARHMMQTSFYENETSSIWPESGKVFPSLLFNLDGQSKIESLNSSNSSKKIAVLLNTDYEDFLEKVKKELFGIYESNFFTWYRPDGSAAKERSNMFKKAYDAYLSLYQAGPIPLDENWATSCFDEAKETPFNKELYVAGNKNVDSCNVDEVSPREVINEFTSLVDYLKLSKRDLVVVDGLNSQSIYGEVLSRFFVVDGMKSNEWRWFDKFFYTNFASAKLGGGFGRQITVEAIPHGREITSFIDEVEATFKPENHIIFHDSVYRHLRNKLKAEHYLKVNKILDFENTIFEVEKEQALGEVPIEIALTTREREVLLPSTDIFSDLEFFGDLRVLRAPLLPGEPDSGQKEYLSRTKGPYKWFWGNFGLFYNRQTSCFLLPEAGDFDASYYSEISQSSLRCRAKAEKFVDKLIEEDRGFDGLIQSL